MLHHRVQADTKPLRRSQTAASKPGHEQALGLGAFHLFSLSLFIEHGRRLGSGSLLLPRLCRAANAAFARLKRSQGLISVGTERLCKAAEKGEGPEV